MNLSAMNRVSVFSVTAIGVPANLTLLWLILKQSGDELAAYSRVLLQACLCDLTMILLLLLTQPVVIDDFGISTVLLNGPLGALLNPWNIVINISYVFFLAASFCQPCVQFFYRFLLVTRNYKLPIWAYLLILVSISSTYTLFINLQIFLPNTAPVYPCCRNPDLPALLGFDNNQKAIVNSLTFVVRSDNPMNAITMYIVIGMDIANVIAIFTFRHLALRFLRQNLLHQPSNQTTTLNDVHRKLNLVFTIQAVFPLLMIVPDILILAQAFFTIPFPVAVFGYIFTEWYPASSPLITMFTVKQYRQTLLRRRNKVAAVVPPPLQHQQ